MMRDAAQVLKLAQEQLRSGEDGGFMVRKSGRVEKPVPILEPNGGIHSWFVPVVVGEFLAGFFEYRPDLTLIRYSSFQRQGESLEGCPKTELWIDANAIQRRLKKYVRPGEKIRKPFLTYDEVPSRLAWLVVFESPDGKTRGVYTAGNVVWEASSRLVGQEDQVR